MSTTRRDFLKTTAAAGALATTPYIWTSSYARAQDQNSRRTIASIGVGGSRGRYSRGRDIADAANRLGDIVAVCDVDDRHVAEANDRYGSDNKMYTDYRKLFDEMTGDSKPDIVTIGTPDHWHVSIAIRALEAGCDVYCEKPLTLTIDEGKAIRKAVADTGQVFQVGTQQRSEFQRRFLWAVAMVQSGRLGEKVNAYAAIETAPSSQPITGQAAPDDLDWDMWLGQARKAEYSQQRRQEFRWFYDYSGGKMTDWGAHHVDIALWALGQDKSGPVKVSGTGQFTPLVPDNFNWNAYLNGDASLPSGFNTATQFSINLEFANGSVLSVNNNYSREDGTNFGNGILFEGDKGRIFVNRSRLNGSPVENLTDADVQELEAKITELYKGKQPGNHMANFFEAVEERGVPISDVDTHHRTMTCCHLCNIALMLGRDLTWDPVKEEFVGDEQATALQSRKRREGFGLQA